MTFYRVFAVGLAAAGLFGGSPSRAFAEPLSKPVPTVSTINVPGAVGNVMPRGINDRGDIVGFFATSTPGHFVSGFLIRQGVVSVIDAPGAAATYLLGINNQGDIAGYFERGDTIRGFIIRGGNFTTIDAPGATGFGDYTIPVGINNHGDIVGYYFLQRLVKRIGFIARQGAYVSFVLPFDGAPLGLNDKDDIVGYIGDANGFDSHGFLLSKGVFSVIDAPNAHTTVVRGINNLGEIVGTTCPSLCSQGFVLRNGAYSYFDAPGAATDPWSINSFGNVVGDYLVEYGVSLFRGFFFGR